MGDLIDFEEAKIKKDLKRKKAIEKGIKKYAETLRWAKEPVTTSYVDGWTYTNDNEEE